jgi:hypothetical protein
MWSEVVDIGDQFKDGKGGAASPLTQPSPQSGAQERAWGEGSLANGASLDVLASQA